MHYIWMAVEAIIFSRLFWALALPVAAIALIATR